jgi:hypothetical protein
MVVRYFRVYSGIVQRTALKKMTRDYYCYSVNIPKSDWFVNY